VAGGAERKDALFGAALFLVPARTAEGRVESVMVERLFQPLRLPHIGVKRAVIEGIDAARFRFGVAPNEQVHARRAGRLFPERIHVAKLPRRIDMEQRERRRRGMERLARQVQHHRRILADRIEHDRTLRLGHDLAHDMDRFGFEAVEMG
jgi:hypothetical protein